MIMVTASWSKVMITITTMTVLAQPAARGVGSNGHDPRQLFQTLIFIVNRAKDSCTLNMRVRLCWRLHGLARSFGRV